MCDHQARLSFFLSSINVSVAFTKTSQVEEIIMSNTVSMAELVCGWIVVALGVFTFLLWLATKALDFLFKKEMEKLESYEMDKNANKPSAPSIEIEEINETQIL